jgi:tetratricopeptide (TPR) repeat protein
MIRLVLTLVFVGDFTLALFLDPRMQALRARADDGSGFVAALMGDSRRLFANQFFVEADVYFHSGFYPTIFDTPEAEETLDVNSKEEAETPGAAPASGRRPEKDEGGSFLGPPRDWVERFGRHFMPTQHTHLANGKVAEILPWLRLSADLDPHRIQTYLTASYWLRGTLNQPDEAEQFLREGLRANPDSYEIFIELGYVFDFNRKNPRMARNLFELALDKWKKQDGAGLKPSPKARVEILDGLVRADEEQNDLKQLLPDLESLKAVSPFPDAVEKDIQETRAKLAAPAPGRPD